MQGPRDDDVIIIKAPKPEGLRIPPPTMHSAFNLLNIATHASLVGNLGADAAEFSKVMQRGSVWQRYEDGSGGYASLYIKTPGTDFYLPRELSQFQRALEKILDYHYKDKKINPCNKDGSEYCHVIAYQKWEQPDGEGGFYNPHLDMNVHEVVAAGKGYNDERYVVSDAARMGTIFYDADLAIKNEDLQQQGKEHWDAHLDKFFNDHTSSKKKFSAYDIVHFNSTTGHAREKPFEPVFRTFMTVGLGAGYGPTQFQQPLNNPWLEKALTSQGRTFHSSLLYAPG